MNKYIAVDIIAKNYLEKLGETSKSFDLSKFFSSPYSKKIKETFQIIALMRGIQVITNKRWFVLLNEDDPPDFFVATQDLDGDGKEIILEGKVENLMIPRQAEKQTNNFSEKGVADFIYSKKPPHELADGTILGIYCDFTTDSFRLDIISQELKKKYTKEEIWLYSAIDPLGSRWIISKLHPDFQKQAIYNLW